MRVGRFPQRLLNGLRGWLQSAPGCGRRITAITSASQADDEGSTPFARSRSGGPLPFDSNHAARHLTAAGAVALCCLNLAWPLTAAAQAASAEQLYEKLHASVVKVHVREYVAEPGDGTAVSSVGSEGSGVVFSADGKVLTVAHLVQTADQISVEFDDGQRVSARVYAAEPAADVALLQLARLPEGKPPVTLGRSDAVRSGQRAIVVGAPFGLAGMLSAGHISGRHQPGTPFGRLEQLEMFVLDAYVEHGSSGGGVFDAEGRLIGLVTRVQFRTGQSRGLGFAVTADTVRALLVERRSFWTGIGGYWVCDSLAQHLNLPQAAGLLVQRVAHHSPAAQLGLLAGDTVAEIANERFVIGGDIILRGQGIVLSGRDDYARMMSELAKLRDGDLLQLTVLRGGRLLELSAPVRR